MQQSNQLAKTRRELEAAMRGVKDPAKLAEMQADSAALRRQVLAVQEKIRALKNPPLGGTSRRLRPQ